MNISKYYLLFVFLGGFSFVACCDDDEVLESPVADIRDFQGIWRDTIVSDGRECIEELVVSNYAMTYTLSDLHSCIVYDQRSGLAILGENGKMGWYCSSLLTGESTQTVWTVKELTPDNLVLISNLLGERQFWKMQQPVMKELSSEASLEAVLQYTEVLPLDRDGVKAVFGSAGVDEGSRSLTYKVQHPLYNHITFSLAWDNDSVYSVSFALDDVDLWRGVVAARFTKIRELGSVTDYCDAAKLSEAASVASIDAEAHTLTFSPIRDYDYWPDVRHYLGRTLQDVKSDYRNFAYAYSTYKQTGRRQYDFKTEKAGVVQNTSFVFEANEDVVSRSACFLLDGYKDEETLLHLLRSRYLYDRYEAGYHYLYPYPSKEKAPYEVRYLPERGMIGYFKI